MQIFNYNCCLDVLMRILQYDYPFFFINLPNTFCEIVIRGSIFNDGPKTLFYDYRAVS